MVKGFHMPSLRVVAMPRKCRPNTDMLKHDRTIILPSWAAVLRCSSAAQTSALRAAGGPVYDALWTGSRAVVVQVMARPRAVQGGGVAAVVRRPTDRQRRRPACWCKGIGPRSEEARVRPLSAVGSLEHARVWGAGPGWHDKDKVDPLVLVQRR